MASLRHSPRTSLRAFTLIEILVVVGLLVFVGAFSLIMSMESFRSSIFKDDRALLVSALLEARSQAVNNMCFGSTCTDGLSHGVHVEPGSYVVFQGNTYNAGDPFNRIIEGNPGVTITGPTDIVFTKLSGEATPSGAVTLADGSGHSSTVTVNSEGMVMWSF